MQAPKSYTGKALCLFSNAELGTTQFGICDIATKPYESISFAFKGNILSESMDYDRHLDAYIHQSDDGHEHYSTLHILALGEHPLPTTPIPPQEIFNKKGLPAVIKVTEAILDNKVQLSDFSYLLRAFTSWVLSYDALTKNGYDVDASHAHLLKSYGIPTS